MYGLRYGTLPLVRAVGGLADTVVDASGEAVAQDRATGFVFGAASEPALVEAVERAVRCYRDAAAWRKLTARAMRENFSWEGPAAACLRLYGEAVAAKAGGSNVSRP